MVIKILTEIHLPINALPSDNKIIPVRTKLYWRAFLAFSSSLKLSVTVNLLVNVNARYRLTDMAQPLMIAWMKKTRTIPNDPPKE